jgi:REP-associated tyrosine transposase
MTNYRRLHTKGATFFFTVVLADRSSATLVDEVAALRDAYTLTRQERPFRCDAFVVLPDHLHAIWTLPEGDADFSTRWGAIKARFTRSIKAGGKMGLNPILRSPSKFRKGDGGIWQRRFWEHCIRDADDLAMHIRYCWGNPVKLGLVDRAVDWPYSSIHRDIRAGRVEPEWAGAIDDGTFGEP